MALRSMTGFGAGSASGAGLKVCVELSSVNRKQLDVHVSLPRSLAMLDGRIQKRVQTVFSRGRISGAVRVELEERATGNVQVQEALAEQYILRIRKVAKQLGLDDNLGADVLVRIPGLVQLEQAEFGADDVGSVLEDALDLALDAQTRMREEEGRALEMDLRTRLALLSEYVDTIEKLAPTVVPAYRQRLLDRLAAAKLDGLENDERIVKEVALFADRCDITEELTRLRSHLSQVEELLNMEEPVGRTLDFLCQELFREINTTGSKANEVEITREVVAFKTELERIREQVQNVE